MSSKATRKLNRIDYIAERSSDEDYEGSEENWRSDNEWKEDSSMAGEASVMSEGSEEEQAEEEGEEILKIKTKQNLKNKPAKFNLDDVGSEDDGESKHQENITERTKGMYSRSNTSDGSEISDIEDHIAEARNKFLDDKKSLYGVMGLVNEVTIRDMYPADVDHFQQSIQETGETLARKASETSLEVERDSMKKDVFSNDRLSLLDDEDMSLRSYSERIDTEEDHIPQKENVGKAAQGRIVYLNYNENEERNAPTATMGLGHIEYLDESESNNVPITSEYVNLHQNQRRLQESNETQEYDSRPCSNISEAEESVRSVNKSGSNAASTGTQSLKSSKSSETFVSRVSAGLNEEEIENKDVLEVRETEEAEEIHRISEAEDESKTDEEDERVSHSSEVREFEDLECSRFGQKHLCCFLNFGGGGDDGKQNELANRLKKLKDDIANMRKELSIARQECKKESEEVAKLIESAAARNKAAEQNEIALFNNSLTTPTMYNTNYALEETPTTNLLARPATIIPQRAQVAIPTALLENRLRATRQTASSNYRESLNELERMVEKEMASIKDSMIRLEPLNKIAAEWDAAQIRDPKRTTYKRDYRLEMVTSEMRLQAPNAKNMAIEEIK